MTNFIKIISFLTTNWWTESWENDKFTFYKPPVSLGFDSEYNFLVLNNVNDARYMDVFEKYVDTLSGIYDKNSNELLHMIDKNSLFFQQENAWDTK